MRRILRIKFHALHMRGKEIIMTGSTMTNLNIRIDKSVKAEAEALFAELGLNMTTAINLFVRQTLRQRKIPFEIAAGGKNSAQS
jgi:DNA-damage-inducible protein J